MISESKAERLPSFGNRDPGELGNGQSKKISVLRVQSCFLQIRPFFFHRPPALPSPLSIILFYIFFERPINIIESFAFSPG